MAITKKRVEETSSALIDIRERIAIKKQEIEEMKKEEEAVEMRVLSNFREMGLKNMIIHGYRISEVEGSKMVITDEKTLFKFCSTRFKEGLKTSFDNSAIKEAMAEGKEIPGVEIEPTSHLRVALIN